MSVSENNKRISITLSIEDFNAIKHIADRKNISMAEVIRDWTIQGLNGSLTEKNLDLLIPIIRNQLKSILDPAVNRLATLSAKACVQAGAAAYLSAEALNSFVPPDKSQDFVEAYESARKKSVAYLRGNADLSD